MLGSHKLIGPEKKNTALVLSTLNFDQIEMPPLHPLAAFVPAQHILAIVIGVISYLDRRLKA